MLGTLIDPSGSSWVLAAPQKLFQCCPRITRLIKLLMDVYEFQTNAREHFLVRHQAFQKFSPVFYLSMFENKFQSNVFDEQILRRTENSRKAFFSSFVIGGDLRGE